MGRIGIEAKDAIKFVEKILKMSNLFIKGICTHFATSDEKNLTYANEQLKIFRSIVTELELRGIHIPLVHCANSGAIMQMPDSFFDMVRPGIMMYGYAPSNEFETKLLLKPVLSLKAKIGFVKRVEQGQSISYNRRFITKKQTNIATVTVGYADGFFRLLTNNSFALIKGKRFPIVGTICMDQIMIDVGDEKLKIGDDVVLIGKSGKEFITANDVATRIGTIPYEVICAISQRVPRKHIHG